MKNKENEVENVWKGIKSYTFFNTVTLQIETIRKHIKIITYEE